MFLRSLQLTNYRNFRRLALTLDDGPSIIQADNAQGKTNLLEAIELLATAKSPRAGSDRELVHWAVQRGDGDALSQAEPFGRVSAVVAHERGEMRADVLLRLIEAPPQASPIPPDERDAGRSSFPLGEGGTEPPLPLGEGGGEGVLLEPAIEAARPRNGGGRDARAPAPLPGVAKTFRLNGVPRRALEFVGEINVVSFSPEDVALVAGPPAGRRRYLDVTNGQMSRRYLRTLQRYNKVLVQRNQLLRNAREFGRADASLPVWDQELAGSGAFLFQERARALGALNGFADRWFRELGGWGQQLAIQYRPGLGQPEAAVLRGVPPENDAGLGSIHNAFLSALQRMERRERSAGMSLVGPHRDDLSFVVDGIDLNVYGSRGQQRLAALSLKLAELDLLAARNGSRPILLLDDVLSELDKRTQTGVLRVAGGPGQTLLTVTSLDLVDRGALSGATTLRLEAGALVGGCPS